MTTLPALNECTETTWPTDDTLPQVASHRSGIISPLEATDGRDQLFGLTPASAIWAIVRFNAAVTVGTSCCNQDEIKLTTNPRPEAPLGV